MSALNNPGDPGPFLFDTVIYASAGINYSACRLGPVQHLRHARPRVHHAEINIAAFGNLGSGAVAVHQHDRTAQRPYRDPARTGAVPARRVRARQPRPARELDAGIPLPLPAARLARHHRRDDRRQLPQRRQFRRERCPGDRASGTSEAVPDLEQHSPPTRSTPKSISPGS